jgi:transcriptional regulator with XRE-family HTH domain
VGGNALSDREVFERGPWIDRLPAADRQSESLGAVLTQVRLASGRSQLRVAEQLCAASGVATVSRHEVSRWEREERIPTGFWLSWLAAVLDVPLGELQRAAAVTRRRRPARPPVTASRVVRARWQQLVAELHGSAGTDRHEPDAGVCTAASAG